ncbi:MAG: TraM recognition domain-containing protein [Pseudomonadota bacterium]
MSVPVGSIFGRRRTFDPEGQRLIGFSLESGRPIFAPKGHGILLSANGGGKTTRGAMVWLYSLLSTAGQAATLVLDSKNGEMAVQAVPMLAEMGIPVAIIDDMDVWPELSPWRVALNPFGAAVAAAMRDPRDLVYVLETITLSLIPEPKDDAKNKYFRAWPRSLISFGLGILLKRNPATATPGAVSSILSDPDMLLSFARIEAEEGDGPLRSQAQAILGMVGHEHWPQHLEEAQRALRIYADGTRLHAAGLDATTTHADLIRSGTVVFLVGPQARIDKLGSYYACHLDSFADALFQGAGEARIVGDEITNAPTKELLVDRLTTIRAFGGQIFAIGQSRSEFVRKFGEQETRTIEDNAIVKQWFGFSSFEEADRASRAIGDEFALSSGLSGETAGFKSQESLSLNRQRLLSPATLMAMPSDQQLVHIKGVGFFMAGTIAMNEVAPYCHLISDNPLEGGRLPPKPKFWLKTPKRTSGWRWI